MEIKNKTPSAERIIEDVDLALKLSTAQMGLQLRVLIIGMETDGK